MHEDKQLTKVELTLQLLLIVLIICTSGSFLLYNGPSDQSSRELDCELKLRKFKIDIYSKLYTQN